MRKMKFVIPAEYDGRKVVHFLRGAAGCSASLVKWLKTYPDGILLNDMHARTIDRLRTGDILSLSIREPETKQLERCAIQVPILYEEEDLLIFNKPADMPCHPSRRYQQGTLANVYASLCDKRGIEAAFRAVNRLDRNTTGAVLVAKNTYAAAALSGKTTKFYAAVVSGVPWPPKGSIDAPIGRPKPQDVRRAVMEGGQPARTDYQVLGVEPGYGYSLVLCTLPTGRTHQIRVHMAHIGHPLLGDDLYGGDCSLIARQALHCMAIGFHSPTTGKRLLIHAPLPQDMQKLLGQITQTC